MDEHQLEGLWSYTAYEEGGKKRLPDLVAKMVKFVLLGGEFLPGWNGLWAVVEYGFQGGRWSELEIVAWCRNIILGTTPADVAPTTDIYLYAGGRFRIAPQKSPKEIDFEQFWKGTVLPSTNLGLFRLDSERLTLCLAEPGHPRPSKFSSGESTHQTLGELVRKSKVE